MASGGALARAAVPEAVDVGVAVGDGAVTILALALARAIVALRRAHGVGGAARERHVLAVLTAR